jgi:two-component system sensor histidine kinase RegB
MTADSSTDRMAPAAPGDRAAGRKGPAGGAPYDEGAGAYRPQAGLPVGRAADDGPVPEVAGRVRLRTLNLIRWAAIAGQFIALMIVHFGLGWSLPLTEALASVAASVLLNLALTLRRPERGRLGEREAAAYLAFDVLQLACLLYLTGGLENPFALLILGPVTVSATVLSRHATVLLCGLAGAAATSLAIFHQPLPWPSPGFALPDMYVWGLWCAVTLGIVFIAAYAGSVAAEGRRMSGALAATQLALAREQRLASLGGLAAAAAHELGSPLSSIAITVRELIRETPPDSPLAEELEILRSEAERCRAILAELGRRPDAEDALSPFARQPLSVAVRSAADRYARETIAIEFDAVSEDGSAEPTVARSPELVHGLGNLLHNAVQFAARRVTVSIRWSARDVAVSIRDDGKGFAPAVLDRLGEPYISSRPGAHLGLGVFIAQTLLENTGAALTFRNYRDSGGRTAGAQVDIVWPRHYVDSATAG